MDRPWWGTRLAAAVAVAIATMHVHVVPARAARACDLPGELSLTVEERALLDGGGAGVVITGSPAPSTGLRVGDVLRQANGRRVAGCEDLEAAAADARARGLVLLLAAERDGRLLAAAVATAPESPVGVAAVVPPPANEPVPHESEGPHVAARPTATPVATPAPVREVELPPRGDVSAEIAAKAVAAAAVLGTVDEAARSVVPLPVYERRLDEATNAIVALRIEGEGSTAVRALVTEALGYHEAARDIRRYKAAELSHARVDQRGPASTSLPYFSDSEVPRWMERYPFLGETLQQAPRTTHMLLPGEMAGRWNPDRAVELLWERAASAATRLSAWGAGK